MNEKDLFNKDTMYWREINFLSPDALAEIELFMPYLIDGSETLSVKCYLLPFKFENFEYQMENGGSFLKKEVTLWPFVLINDFDIYNNPKIEESERNSKIKTIEHSNVKSITLKDKANNIVLKKSKI